MSRETVVWYRIRSKKIVQWASLAAAMFRGWRIRPDVSCRDVCAPLGSGKRRHAKERHVCATQELPRVTNRPFLSMATIEELFSF